MNNPFWWFLSFVTVIFVGMYILWRKAIEAIGRQVTEHAKLNARAYVRGAVFVAVAAITDFIDAFEGLSSDVAAVLPWWSWLTFFLKPLLGALVTLGAFLDTSAQRNQPAPPKEHS